MILSLIVAVDEQGAMGKDNQLPWHLPADLAFFKKHTLGKPVLMGRRTWESLGRKLPGRLNIVLSSLDLELPEGVLLYGQLPLAIARMKEEPVEEAFVIGGSRMFSDTLPALDRMYITRVRTVVDAADTFFPMVDYSDWKLTFEEAHEPDEKNKFAYTFQIWERA